MKFTLKNIAIILAIVVVVYVVYTRYIKEKYYRTKGEYSGDSNRTTYQDFGHPSCDKNVNRVDNYPTLIEGYHRYSEEHNPVSAWQYKTHYTDPIDLTSDARDCAMGDNPYACDQIRNLGKYNGNAPGYIL